MFAVGPDALNDAYLMTWMVLWFQTSSTVGAVLGCQPVDVDPPSGCGLVDPASLGISSRPPAGLEPDWSSGTPREFDRGVFLSILGFLLGMWHIFAAGLANIIESVEEGWDEFRCYIYWWRMYFINALNIMHESLQFYAITYPYSRELVHGTNTLHIGACPACGTPNILTRSTCINCGAALTAAVQVPIDFGWRLTRSRVVTQDFPARLPVPPNALCPGNIFDVFWWVLHPRSGWANLCFDIEDPHTTAYMYEEYPEFFIDSNRNSLRDGIRTQPVSIGPVEFGNAVDNAVDLFGHLIPEPGSVLPDIPDWNLDADRGMAYLTWRFRDDIYTDPANIFPES